MPYILLLIVLLASSPVPGQASTYRWLDANGVTHFTDNPDTVPDAYLSRVKELPSIRGEGKTKASQDAPASTGATAPPAAGTHVAAGTPVGAGGAKGAEKARLSLELKKLKEGLALKKAELNRLHHKWTVSKGRTPTADEVKEFGKKRAKGKATHDDNPYVGRGVLSSPGPARAAYFKQLDEVRKDEDTLRQLEQDLQALLR